MARYRRFEPRFWKDEKVRTLILTEKSIAIYCFTAQSNRIGIFSFSPGEACEDLELKPETFAKGFGNVCRTLDWRWDERHRVMYIPTWWKYNPPENENNVIGNLKDLAEVPQSPLLSLFSNNLRYLPETLHQTFTQTLAKRYPKCSPSQEQYQEQYQEQEQEPLLPPKGDDGFLQFWKVYPNQKEKGDAEKAWKVLRPDKELQQAILSALETAKRSQGWTKDGGQFIPYPAKWLRRKCWEDGITPAANDFFPFPFDDEVTP